MGLLSSLIYVLASFFTGGLLILVSLRSLQNIRLEGVIAMVQNSDYLRTITGLSGLLVILVCIKTIQNSLAKSQREKTIAFEGTYGQVSIGLSAVEDMIKKLLLEFKELKDVKPHVTASKKGLQVILRIILSSFTNIPEFTGKIQNLVRERLQSMLGIEEEILIKVEVRKILYSDIKTMKQEVEETNPYIPYRDFQAK